MVAADTIHAARGSVTAVAGMRRSDRGALPAGPAGASAARVVARRPSHDELGVLLRRSVRERQHAVRAPLLQRMIGFEAEVMAPSFGPNHAKLQYKKLSAVSDEVASFLDGGVPYGTNIGGKGQPIRIDSDHGDKISRRPIIDKLAQMGWVRGKPKEPKTKLEYVTHAIDELAPDSDQAFVDIAADLKDKLDKTIQDAKSGDMHQLGAPAKQGYMTGVPVADLKAWLGGDYAQIAPLVKDFIDNKTSDSVYLQATVGIIPSGLRKFLHQAALPGGSVVLDPPSAARRKVLGIVETAVADLEKDPAFANHQWVQGLAESDHEALMGILSLVFCYLLGDTLHRTTGGTSSTVKNAVPFLIKHGPFNLTELAGTHNLRRNPPPRFLVRTIGRIFKRSKYLQQKYWVEGGAGTAKGEGLISKRLNARTPKEGLVQGDYVDVVEAFLGFNETPYTKLIGLLNKKDVQAVVGKELPGMDQPVKDSGGVNVFFESYNQMGIPLEYRWISKQYKVNELQTAMFEIVGDVREANMRELTDEQKDLVRDAFKGN